MDLTRRVNGCLLVSAVGVVPLHQRVSLCQRLREFGITPIGPDRLLDVIAKKIGKGLPRLRPVNGVSDCDYLVLIRFDSDDRSTKPLLLFPNALFGVIYIELVP